MGVRRPLSDLGDREDWISPAHARRAKKHTPPGGCDSECYPPDINGYRPPGEAHVFEEGSVPGARIGGLPGAGLDGPPPIEDRDSRIRLRRTDQVNVRLTTPQFQDLAEAGELYGLSPTEMARLFINRGARAVLTGR
jgi:hypothetical protein